MGREGKGWEGKERGHWWCLEERGLGWAALATHLPAEPRVGPPHHSHPSSIFGEGAAPLVGAGVMLMLCTSVCHRAVASAGPGTLPFPWVLQGKLVGNCSP